MNPSEIRIRTIRVLNKKLGKKDCCICCGRTLDKEESRICDSSILCVRRLDENQTVTDANLHALENELRSKQKRTRLTIVVVDSNQGTPGAVAEAIHKAIESIPGISGEAGRIVVDSIHAEETL